MKNQYYLFILSFLLISCEELVFKLNIQIDPIIGGKTLPSSGEYIAGTNLIIEAIPSNDYSFDKWIVDGVEVFSNPLTYVTKASDQTIIAQFIYSLDSDNDGITDDKDICPNTLNSTDVDEFGCPYLYLAENGITVKANEIVKRIIDPASAFYEENREFLLNGISYLPVYSPSQLKNLVKEKYNLTKVNTTFIKDLDGVFSMINEINGEIKAWDISNVKSLSWAFLDSSINPDISIWDVSNVENMYGVFDNALFNGDISNWDVSNVVTMESMFRNSKFNGNISNWDVSKVVNMNEMFRESEFNQEISSWNVGRVESMNFIFNESIFNKPIGDWDVSKVKEMIGVFKFCIFDQNLSNWDVSNVTEMGTMFMYSQFNQDISNWDVSNVTGMGFMFFDSKKFNQDLSNWDVSKVVECSSFKKESDLYILPIPNFTLCNPN